MSINTQNTEINILKKLIGKKMNPIRILFFIIATLNISSVFSSGIKKDDHCEEVLISLQQRLDQHIEHLEDTIESLRDDTLTAETEGGIKSTQRNITSVQTIKNQLSKVLHNEYGIEEMLRYMMLSRLSTLQIRSNNIRHARKTPHLLYFLTHPLAVENADPTFRFIPESTIDLYQTFNDVILSLASLFDLRNLHPNTKKIIRASPSLWQRLQGLEQGLGYPDEALLDFTAFKQNDTLQDITLLEKGDLYFYERFLKESIRIVYNEFSTFRRYTATEYVTPYDADIILHQENNYEDLPYPEFLFSPLRLSVTKHFSIQTTPANTTSKKRQQQRKSKPSSSTQRKGKGRGKRITTHKAAFITNKVTRKKIDTEAQQKDSLVKIPSQKEALPKDLEPESAKHPEEIDTKKQLDDVIDIPSSSTSAASSSSTSPMDIPESEEEPQPSLHLSGGHIKTIERIFNPRAYSKTRFSDFQTLWEYLGGRIGAQKSGGSHRSIIWKNSVIEGTYIPHNGHRYGPRAIKRLRHALDFIGCGKKFLESD